jgi:serine/threonine protein phosphatase PrpC
MSLSAARRPEDVTPYFAEFETRAEDVLVLCSDGLWAVLTDSEIKAVVTDLSLADAARKLVAMANASHGPDNITAVLALFKPRGVQQESPSAPVEEDATGPGL